MPVCDKNVTLQLSKAQNKLQQCLDDQVEAVPNQIHNNLYWDSVRAARGTTPRG